MPSNEKETVPLTTKELELVVEALNEFYMRTLTRAERLSGHARPKKVSQHLAFIQETLQYVMLVRNIRTGKLNPDVAISGGLDVGSSETPDSSGTQELAGN